MLKNQMLCSSPTCCWGAMAMQEGRQARGVAVTGVMASALAHTPLMARIAIGRVPGGRCSGSRRGPRCR